MKLSEMSMKKIIIILFMCLIIGSSVSHGATMVVFDGRLWNPLKYQDSGKGMRVALIRGFYEGVWFADPNLFNARYYLETDYGTLVDAVDRFYGDHRNTNIILGYALQVIAMELRGEDKKKIDDFLKELRSKALDYQKK